MDILRSAAVVLCKYWTCLVSLHCKLRRYATSLNHRFLLLVQEKACYGCINASFFGGGGFSGVKSMYGTTELIVMNWLDSVITDPAATVIGSS